MDKEEARRILREKGLRITGPRLAVVQLLSEAEVPLSYTQVLEQLGDQIWDPTTVYRNLIKLRDAGVATVANRVDGADRYVLTSAQHDQHRHPHFVCSDCGRVSCLPSDLAPSLPKAGAWSTSLQSATVQFRGECPDCVDQPSRGA